MNVTTTEKLSIARLLWGLLIADNEFDPRECEVILTELNINAEFLISSRDYSYNLSISTLKVMSDDKKSMFCQLMLKVMNADEIIRQSELNYIKKVLTESDMISNLISYAPLLHATFGAYDYKQRNGFA